MDRVRRGTRRSRRPGHRSRACSPPARRAPARATRSYWYINPDAGGQAKVAENCSTDDYTIKTQVLPQDASQQRIQLARRLAAEDPEIDIMSIDPPYTAEFANAGFLAPIPDDLQAKLKEQSFKGAIDAATWDDQLVVAPFWSNTQVLWYRKSFAEKAGIDMTQAGHLGPDHRRRREERRQGRGPGQQVRGLRRLDQRADLRRRRRDRHRHRQGHRPDARGRLPGRRGRGEHHREAGRTPPPHRPTCRSPTRARRAARSAGRRARSWSTGPTSGPTTTRPSPR